jgi:hypothetical protein
METIGRVKEAEISSFDINVGKLNEVSFSIPLYVDSINDGLKINKNNSLLIDRTILMLVYGEWKEYFMINSHEDSDDNQYRTIHAFSLGIQLNDKLLKGYVSRTTATTIDTDTGESKTEEVDAPINIQRAITDALQRNRVWTVGYIDPALNILYRQFEFDSVTPLEYIYQIGEKFNAIIEWDTINQKINAYHPDNYGEDKGFKITDEKYISNLIKKSSDDDFCTRLYLEGSEGLTINSVHPTGQSYIEDYSYFINTNQMSDSLKLAMISYSTYVDSRSAEFPWLLAQLEAEQTEYRAINSEISDLEQNLKEATDREDICKATGDFLTSKTTVTTSSPTIEKTFKPDTDYIVFTKISSNENVHTVHNDVAFTWVKDVWNVLKFTEKSKLSFSQFTSSFDIDYIYMFVSDDDNENATNQELLEKYNSSYITSLITPKRISSLAKKSELDAVNAQITQLKEDISIEKHLSSEQLNELDRFIIEKDYIDENLIDAQSLLVEGKKQLEERNKPQVLFDVGLFNFLNCLEEKRNWDKLSAFDIVRIQSKKIDVDIKARIINISISDDSIGLTIANIKNAKNEQDKFIQMLYGAVSGSKTIQKKEWTWDKAKDVEIKLNDYTSSAIDATKQRIVAGINENVVLSERGLKITSTDSPETFLVANHGVIAITHDNGKTWENALTTDGLVAEKVVGHIIAGDKLEIGNSRGSFKVTGEEVTITGGSLIIEGGLPEEQIATDATDKWNDSSDLINDLVSDSVITPYEKNSLKQKWDAIVLEHNTNSSTMDVYYDDPNTLPYFSDYNNSFNSLYDYLFIEKQNDNYTLLSDANMTNKTMIDKTVFSNRFNAYNTSLEEVKKQISIKAKELTDKFQQDLQEAKNDISYHTELHSTAGNQFMNGDISTTVYVVVYKGREDITNTLPTSAFQWKKTDKDGIEDTVWNNSHVGVGSQILIDREDVFRKATFWCDIDIVT